MASQIETSDHLGFAPDCDTVVCNNSANAHICQHRHMFVGKIGKIDPMTGVATIGGEDLHPSGIGMVKWSWDDDEGETHNFFVKKHFFPTSPVNILSVSRLVDHFDDDKGTSIQTRRHYSILRWKKNFRQVLIEHWNHKLPELAVNTGFSSFTTFCWALG